MLLFSKERRKRAHALFPFSVSKGHCEQPGGSWTVLAPAHWDMMSPLSLSAKRVRLYQCVLGFEATYKEMFLSVF